MARIAIQLYSLKDVDGPFTGLLERVADAGFEGVEFAYRFQEADVDEVRATIEETGLTVAGAHVGLGDIEDEFEETVDTYERLGCDTLIVPWLDEEHFADAGAIDAVAERLDAAADRLADRGMRLAYHNHAHEFGDVDGQPALLRLAEATDADVELDLGLALAAGADPVDLIHSLRGRLPLVHVKDYDVAAGRSMPVGRGDLDLGACADALAEAGTEWLVYEYEEEDPAPEETLDDAVDRLAEMRR